MPVVFGYPNDRSLAEMEAARKRLEREKRAKESWARWREERDRLDKQSGGTTK